MVSFATVVLLILSLHPSPAQPAWLPVTSQSAKDELPEVCRQKPVAADVVAKGMLESFERHLVDDVLGSKITHHDDGTVNSLEVRALLHHEVPEAHVAFLFPRRVSLPRSPFRAQLGGHLDSLLKAPYPVLYIQIGNVRMARLRKETALVLNYSAWGNGKGPQLWGVEGDMCVVRREDGGFFAYPLGAMLVG
jgi:hypothetical protein